MSTNQSDQTEQYELLKNHISQRNNVIVQPINGDPYVTSIGSIRKVAGIDSFTIFESGKEIKFKRITLRTD